MSNKRVVITGYGIVSCIGNNKKEVLTSLACTKIIFALAISSNDLKSEINLIDLLTSDINKLQLADINCPH